MPVGLRPRQFLISYFFFLAHCVVGRPGGFQTGTETGEKRSLAFFGWLEFSKGDRVRIFIFTPDLCDGGKWQLGEDTIPPSQDAEALPGPLPGDICSLCFLVFSTGVLCLCVLVHELN